MILGLRGIILLQTFLVIVASFVLRTVESQMIEVHPRSIAVQSDEPNVVLGCNITGLPPSTYIEWIYYPTWHPTGFTIYSTFNDINNDLTNFTVYHSPLGNGTRSFELVINTAKRELATLYMCHLTPIPGFEKFVNVVALDKIECPGDIIVYDEGNGANLSCSINFYDSTLTYFPNIMWYKDGQPISGAYTIIESNNRRTTRLVKNVTSADDNQVFVCMVDFPNSDPDYTDNCSTIFYVKRQAVVSVYPANIGAQRGEQNVVLSCSVTNLWPYHIVWSYFPASHPTGFTIFSTVNNVTNDQTNFSVNPLTAFGNTYSLDLVIKTVTPELATMYRCELSGTNISKSIQVIVLDQVECPGDIVEYDEGNKANISCSVNYYETLSTIAPMVMWYRDGQRVSGVSSIMESLTRITARLTKNVTSDDDDQVFVCIVDLMHWSMNYTDRCSTTFYVRHKVSEMNFYPVSSAEFPFNVAVGETINCTADGRPEPTIEWYDVDGNLLSQFSELTVNENMQTWPQPVTIYCRARNTLDNGVSFAEVEGNYTFNVVDGGIIVQLIELEAWKLTVAVIVPIVVGLAAIAIAVFLIIQHRKAK